MNNLFTKSWFPIGKSTLSEPLHDPEAVESNPAGDLASSSAEAPAQFYAEANSILRNVETARQSLRNIESAYARFGDVGGGPVLADRQQMSEDLSLIAARAQNMKDNLADIQRDRLTLLKRPGGGNEAADMQRHTVHAHLLQKVQKLAQDIQAARATVDSEHFKVVERRLLMLTGQELSSEEVESFLQNPPSENLIRQALQHQRDRGGRDSVVATIADLHERQKGVDDLSAALEQLRTVLQDLSVTVENDMHVLDRIEDQVRKGHEDVNETVPMLHTGATFQRRSCRWLLFLIPVVILVVAGGVGILFFLFIRS